MNILVDDDKKDMPVLFEQRFRKEIRGGQIWFTFANSGEEALESGTNKICLQISNRRIT